VAHKVYASFVQGSDRVLATIMPAQAGFSNRLEWRNKLVEESTKRGNGGGGHYCGDINRKCFILKISRQSGDIVNFSVRNFGRAAQKSCSQR